MWFQRIGEPGSRFLLNSFGSEFSSAARIEHFVRQEEARGVELANGSDLERALALLITQRRLEDRSFTAALEKK